MAIMSSNPSRLRSVFALIAWAGVTAVAATGSWLGMSTVLTDEPAAANVATVVTPSASASSQSGSRSGDGATDEWNGWNPVGEDTYERSFHTDGGSAVVRLTPQEVEFVSASPTEGFTADREWPSTRRLVITFDSDTDKVTIDCGWRDGEPYARVSQA